MRRIRSIERAGFTLVEVLLALGLLSVLAIALIRLVDTSLKIWNRTEAARDLQEMGGGVLDLFAEDLYSIDAGPRGDLVGDWARFDIDRDGDPGAIWPRVRFVRQATAADLLRLRPKTGADTGTSGISSGVKAGTIDPLERGLVEVCWALLPAGQVPRDERPLGLLWRGQRLLTGDSVSFLDDRFFSAANKPAPGSLELVTGGVLWFETWYAAQTSIVHDGWSLGDKLSDCASSWDAFNRARPKLEVSYLNTPAAGMPTTSDLPLMPRRVRVLLELERPADLKYRTRLDVDIDDEVTSLGVGDEARVPDKGRMILVDEEWMQVLSKSRGRVTVVRARRGTRPVLHQAGTLIHFGNPMSREIPVPVMREDWNL